MLKEDEKKSAVKTEAQKSWEEIKDLPMSMYGLPDQTVKDFCSPVSVEPSALYVKIKYSAVLPALESVVSGKFLVEASEVYISIKRVKDKK